MPDRAVVMLGVAAAILAAVGTLDALVEAASLSFLFTFCVVCGLAFREGAGLRLITGAVAVAAALACGTLMLRLSRTDPLALVFVALIGLLAIFGRPLILRHVRLEDGD